MRLRRLLLPLILAGFLGIAPLQGQDATGDAITDLVQIEVTGAFDGLFREGFWSPLRVQVSNQGDAISGSLTVRPETSGASVDNAFSTPIDLPTGSNKVVTLYIRPNSIDRRVDVELLDADGERMAVQAAFLQPVAYKDRFYVQVVGPSGGAFAFSPATGGYGAQQALVGIAALPDRAIGYDGVDILLFSNLDSAAMTALQRAALDEWLAGGGHLLVTGGPSWRATGEAIADWLPLVPSGSQTVRDLRALAALAGDPDGRLTGEAVLATGDLRAGASVLARADDLPLWVRGRYGLGTVDYLTFDPSLAPLNTWGSLADFWWTLAATRDPIPGWTHGVMDAQQATTAVAVLPGVALLPSVLSLCGFLLAYIAVIGPLNYWILTRMNRRAWAWVTIPLAIILFTFVAYTVGFNLRGNEVVLSRLNLVERWGDDAEGRLRQTLGLLAPRRSTFSLVADDERAMFVMAAPGSAPGRGGNITQATANVLQTEGFTVQDFAVDGGFFANFGTQGTTAAPAISGQFTLSVGDDGVPALRGSLRNDGDTTLLRPVLLARGLALHIADLAPGDLRTFDATQLRLGSADEPPVPNRMEYSYAPLTTGFDSVIAYYASFDSLITLADVLGVPFQRNIPIMGDDRDAQTQLRNQSAVAAYLRDQYESTARGDDVYLVGWSETWPDDMTIVDAPASPMDTTLFVVRLPVAFQPPPASQTVTLTPDQFTWATLERDLVSDGGATGVRLPPGGSFVIRYTPVASARLAEVDAFDLFIDRSRGYGALVELEIWDWRRQAWQAMGERSLERYTFDDPADYLGPLNAIQLRMTLDASYSSVEIDRVSVTQTGRYGAP
jgi:hypothetical protein